MLEVKDKEAVQIAVTAPNFIFKLCNFHNGIPAFRLILKHKVQEFSYREVVCNFNSNVIEYTAIKLAETFLHADLTTQVQVPQIFFHRNRHEQVYNGTLAIVLPKHISCVSEHSKPKSCTQMNRVSQIGLIVISSVIPSISPKVT